MTIAYRSITVDGIRTFYREAGAKTAPTILLLHGFPSSSRMLPDSAIATRHPRIGSNTPSGISRKLWVALRKP